MVSSAGDARVIVENWIRQHLSDIDESISLGLPEVDDRYDLWRVPIVLRNAQQRLIGEVKLDANGKVVEHTNPALIRKRVERVALEQLPLPTSRKKGLFYPVPIPTDTAQLVFTSPPYYNAKPESCEFVDYQEYLHFLRRVIVRVREIVSEVDSLQSTYHLF